MQPHHALTAPERLRLLQLRELAPEEFIVFLIEMGELALLRRRQHKASLVPQPMNY